MSARLVGQLATRGIRLRRVGDQLGVTFPDGGETPEAVAYLREHKAELLAGLAPPTFPKWPAAALDAAVTERVAVLKGWGHTTVEAERQAGEESIAFGGFSSHATARCGIHGCPQRREPRGGLYRCPACTPGLFAGGRRAA